MITMVRGLVDTRSLYSCDGGQIITVEVIPHDGRPAWFLCLYDGLDEVYPEGDTMPTFLVTS